MKLRYYFTLSMSFIFIVSLIACNVRQNSKDDSSFNAEKITIEYQRDSNEHENGGNKITITDRITIKDIYRLHSSLKLENTSVPMLFPRYVITFVFVQEDAEPLTWRIDENNILSSSSIGNARIVYSDCPFQYINELFMSFSL